MREHAMEVIANTKEALDPTVAFWIEYEKRKTPRLARVQAHTFSLVERDQATVANILQVETSSLLATVSSIQQDYDRRN